MSTVLFPEMVRAGAEALKEERDRGSDEIETATAVYLAMEAVRQIAVLQFRQGTVH